VRNRRLFHYVVRVSAVSGATESFPDTKCLPRSGSEFEGRSIWVPASLPGIRLASQAQVNVRVVPTGVAIEESVDLAHEIYNRVFRKVLERIAQK
jgi:hypothetical protein